MALRYFKTGATTWNSANNWSATSAGGADNAGVPTAADNVIFELLSGSCLIDVNALCRGLDCTSGTGTYTGTISSGANSLTIGDGTAPAGGVSLKIRGTWTATGNVTLTNTGNSTVTFDANGNTLGGQIQFSFANGTCQLTGDVIAGTAITKAGAGTLDLNGKNITATTTYSNTVGTTTCGAAVITVNGSSCTISNTFTAGTSEIKLLAAGTPILTATGKTLYKVTRTGTATVGDGFSIAGNFTCDTLACSGANVTTQRLLLQSSVFGTARTITVNTTNTFSNTDIQDITAAGAASWNLSAASGGTGDATGNTGITFTTPVSRYAVVAGNTSNTATWSASSGGAGGASVPLCHDSIFFNSSSAAGTYTNDLNRFGADIDFNTFARTFAVAAGITQSSYGNIRMATGMTISGTSIWTFQGRGAQTFTSATKAFPNGITINCASGSYTLQDAFSCSRATAGFLTFTSGTFSDGGQNVTGTGTGNVTVVINGGTVNMTGTWSLAGTSNNTWNYSSGTVNGTGSTIIISSVSSFTRTFAGGGQTYGTLTYTVAKSPSALAITGANTFSTLNIGSGRTLTMPSAVTNTVTTWNVSGANNGYLYLPGLSGSYVSTPDAVPNRITGDITIDVEAALDSWSAAGAFLRKMGSSATRAYGFDVNATGNLQFLFSLDGSALTSIASSVTAGLAAGSLNWVRATRIASTGLVKFYTSPDGSTWTQLGSSVSGTSGNISNQAVAVEVGATFGGTASLAIGKFYRAKLYSSDLGSGSGTPVFDADFTAKAFGANSFTESSANSATVTINGPQAQAGDGRIALTASTPASAATMASSVQQSVDYLTIQDSTVDVSPKWYAGSHSVNVSGNTNWIFTAPPGAGAVKAFGLLGVG